MHQGERVFAFDDPVDYLNFELRERRRRDTAFSLRAWSRRVGYKNPSYLSHVLARKRRLKPELATKLAADLSLTGKPLQYFELIVMSHAGGGTSDNRSYKKLIRSARPRKYESVNQLSLDTFLMISDWYHWAILEMTELAGFELQPAQIRRRLGGRVDIKTVNGAIERLIRAGLLKRDEQGRVKRARAGVNETHAPIAPEAVIAYHKQMGNLGVEAVGTQPRNERDFYGSTLAFRKEHFARAQEIIQDAHRQLLQLAAHGNGEEIYQFNTQFFRLTESQKSRKS